MAPRKVNAPAAPTAPVAAIPDNQPQPLTANPEDPPQPFASQRAARAAQRAAGNPPTYANGKKLPDTMKDKQRRVAVQAEKETKAYHVSKENGELAKANRNALTKLKAMKLTPDSPGTSLAAITSTATPRPTSRVNEGFNFSRTPLAASSSPLTPLPPTPKPALPSRPPPTQATPPPRRPSSTPPPVQSPAIRSPTQSPNLDVPPAGQAVAPDPFTDLGIDFGGQEDGDDEDGDDDDEGERYEMEIDIDADLPLEGPSVREHELQRFTAPVMIDVIPYESRNDPTAKGEPVCVTSDQLYRDPTTGKTSAKLSGLIPLAANMESPLKDPSRKLHRLDAGRIISLGRADKVASLRDHDYLDLHPVRAKIINDREVYTGIRIYVENKEEAPKPTPKPRLESLVTFFDKVSSKHRTPHVTQPDNDDSDVEVLSSPTPKKPIKTEHAQPKRPAPSQRRVQSQQAAATATRASENHDSDVQEDIDSTEKAKLKSKLKVAFLRKTFSIHTPLPGALQPATARAALERHYIVEEMVQDLRSKKWTMQIPADCEDASPFIRGETITDYNIRDALGFGKTNWGYQKKRWATTFLRRSPNIWAWVQDPDEQILDKDGKPIGDRFEHLNSLPFGQLKGYTELDAAGKYDPAHPCELPSARTQQSRRRSEGNEGRAAVPQAPLPPLPALDDDDPALEHAAHTQAGVKHVFQASRTYCVQTLTHSCGFPIAFAKFYESESESQVVGFLNKIWPENVQQARPNYIAYDRACSTLRHLITSHGESTWTKTTRFIVDAFHYIGHRDEDIVCRVWCNPAPTDGSQPDLVIQIEDANGQVITKRAFNTETAEQLNAWFDGFKGALNRMTDYNFDFCAYCFLFLYGEDWKYRVAEELRKREAAEEAEREEAGRAR